MPKPKKENSKNTCIYCGNNPIPHFTYWIFQFSNIFLSKWHNFIFYNPLTVKLRFWLGKKNAGWYFIKLFYGLKLVSFQEDIKKCKTDRARVLWQEADRRGIKMSAIVLLGKQIDAYTAFKVGKTNNKFQTTNDSIIIFEGLPRPKNYYSKASEEMDDKGILKEKLAMNNLPAPKGGTAWSLKKTLKIFKAITKPVIVKTRLGSRGRHVSIFIDSEEKLRKAFHVARQLCPWVIIEEQLTGPIYRATLINFKLCGVLRGDPPQVIGDGKSTIKELIEVKNGGRSVRVKEIVFNEQMNSFVRSQIFPSGFAAEKPLRAESFQLSNISDWVIIKGKVIYLSEKIGVGYGGSSSEDYDICHGDNKDLFIQAAKVVGDPVVGFDFIIPDITKSWKQQKCGFIEANSLPFINLHHDPLLGKPRNVAAKVWEMVGM